MEYQKIANLLNDESNQPSKFRTRNWVEINDEVRGETKSQQCYDLVYVITVMHIYLLKEIYQLIILLVLVLQQIILIKK